MTPFDRDTLINLLEFLGFITVVCVVGYFIIDREIRRRHEVQLTTDEAEIMAQLAEVQAGRWQALGKWQEARRWQEIASELESKEQITTCAGK